MAQPRSQAEKTTGIPQPIIDQLLALSKYVPISIRGTQKNQKPNQRFAQRFSAKPTQIHQKSSDQWPCQGHISELVQFSRKGLDPTDHTFGRFPEGAENLNHKETKTYSHLYQKPGIVKIKKIGNRICYQKRGKRYCKKGKEKPFNHNPESQTYPGFVHSIKEPFAIKHYIQETQSLSHIEKLIETGYYELISKTENKMRFKYSQATIDKIKQTNKAFKANIIFDVNPDQKIKMAHESEHWGEPSLDQVAINMVRKTKEKELIEPVMVQSGNNGYPVTGDFDTMHISLPKNMPSLAFKAPNTYTDGAKIFADNALALRDRITSKPYSTQPEYVVFQSLKVKKNPNDGSLIDPMAPFLEDIYLNAQGKMHIGAFLMNCALNKKIGKNMFLHGEESFNPGKSESFDAVDHFYKGKLIHTDSEKECLAFFLHDPDYLKSTFVNVHPSCLRVREGSEAQVSTTWRDILKIQILNGFEDQVKQNTKEAYKKQGLGNLDDFIETTKKMSEPEKEKLTTLLYQSHYKVYQENIKKFSEQLVKPKTFKELSGAKPKKTLLSRLSNLREKMKQKQVPKANNSRWKMLFSPKNIRRSKNKSVPKNKVLKTKKNNKPGG